MRSTLALTGLILTAIILSTLRINSFEVSFTDELLWEEASYRMATTNQFLIPILNDHVWLEKAPLYFWLTTPLFWLANAITPDINLLDPNQALNHQHLFIFPWVRRVWTVVAAVTTTLYTYYIAKHLFKDYKIGLVAGITLLTTPMFLSTTRSASLDLTATAFITASLYYYLLLINAKSKTSILQPIIIGLIIGLGIMTRSLLALTPLAVIFTHQFINKSPRLSWKPLLTILITTAITILPWHLYTYLHYPQQFLNIYLGFNLIDHAINLTPGYIQRPPWYYLQLLAQNYWSYFALGTIIVIIVKKFKHNSKSFVWDLKFGIWKLSPILLWFTIPLTIFTLSSTRHSWYFNQILPPITIIASPLIYRLIKHIYSQPNMILRHLFEIFILTLILAPPLTVISLRDSAAPVIQAYHRAAQLTPENHTIYSLTHPYLTYTLLYRPRPVELINLDQLPNSSQNVNPFIIFIGHQDTPAALDQLPHLILIKQYSIGSLYQLPPLHRRF